MSPEARAILARITRTIEDLHSTESHLRAQRTVLREAATAIRTGERLGVVVARLKAAKCWALGSVETLAPAVTIE